jgi:periplasmic protein TonB
MQTRPLAPLPDVFSVAELARATGKPVDEVQAWVEVGAIHALPVGDGCTWLARGEAVRSGRALLDGTIGVAFTGTNGVPRLFGQRPEARTALRGPLAVSSALHVMLIGAVVLITTLGLARPTATTEAQVEAEPMRLVYLAIPGPGGGGGGGGLKSPVRAPKAERKDISRLDSPLPVRLPPIFDDPPPKPQPPKVNPEPLPEVMAPVVQAAANTQDRPGVMEPSPTDADTRGSGQDGGVGTGEGTGLGQGNGSGIGEGEGGGIGGGPYRPGSGVLPPSLLREVKPDYTEDARRRGIRGEVLMEIVVRHDGTVGDVRVLSGLGYGLDERAIAAVRQWRFSPATLHGRPVDVMVEVSMEFRLR